ncbi:unnamed protein product [Caenorhabditis nigoni]
MKEHFSIGILLLFCAYGALCDSISISRYDADFKEKLVKLVNKKRMEKAVQNDIANMHEISYNDDLEGSILEDSCGLISATDYVVVKFRTEDDVEGFFNQLQNIVPTREKENDLRARRKASRDTWAAFFHPLETKFGCAQRNDCHNAVVMCAVGPK